MKENNRNKDKENNLDNNLFVTVRNELEILSKTNLRNYNKTQKLLRKIKREEDKLCLSE